MSTLTNINEIEVIDPQVINPSEGLIVDKKNNIPMYPFVLKKLGRHQGGELLTFVSRVKVLQAAGKDHVNIYTLPVFTHEFLIEGYYASNESFVNNKVIPRHLTQCLKHAKFFRIEKGLSIAEVLAKRTNGSLVHESTILKKDLTFLY